MKNVIIPQSFQPGGNNKIALLFCSEFLEKAKLTQEKVFHLLEPRLTHYLFKCLSQNICSSNFYLCMSN